MFQVWEALVTLLFFPVCVILAWIADRRLLFYKYMGKRYRADKRHGIVVETEGDLTPNKGGMEMIIDGKFPVRGGAVVPAENCGGGTQDGTTGAAANNIGAAAGAVGTGGGANLPHSNSATVNVESSKELDESRKEVRQRREEASESSIGEYLITSTTSESQRQTVSLRDSVTRQIICYIKPSERSSYITGKLQPSAQQTRVKT